MQRIHAILPMRRESRRIKNKNIYQIRGRPLYEYILNALLASKLIDKIIINTDIEDVIEKHRNDGKIMLMEREKDLRGNCNMNLVIEDTINKAAGEYFIQVHATSPLLSTPTIDSAIKTFFDKFGVHDSLFSVTKMQKRFWKKDGTPINHSLHDAPTTQDLEPYFEENSCFYLFSRESFMQNNNRIGTKPYLFQTGVIESIDIDTEEELRLAEKILTS